MQFWDEFSHATHACSRASRIAALAGELFASLSLASNMPVFGERK